MMVDVIDDDSDEFAEGFYTGALEALDGFRNHLTIDADPDWDESKGSTQVSLDFIFEKLLDYRDEWQGREDSERPFRPGWPKRPESIN